MTENLEPTEPRVKSRNPLVSWLIGAVVLALLALSAAGYLLLRGGEPEPAAAKPQGEVRIVGYLTLTLGQFVWDKNPDWCAGWRGYDDLKVGTTVVITDAAGTTIALGKIDSADPWRDPVDDSRATSCRMHFEAKAPAGHEFYGIEVSDRGRRQYTPKQIDQGIELRID